MDKDSYIQQIEAHSQMMYRIALTILKNDEDCKDALQETALKAWEKRFDLREIRYFKTWITRILINECYNIQRKKSRFVLMENLPDIPAPRDDGMLMLILDTLPEKLRLPMVLRFSEGMNEREIAKILRLPPSTVRGRIYRGKIQLKKEMDL